MKTVILKLTSAIAIAGQIVKPPALIEVTEGEARDLLNRGKAELATADEPVSARSIPADQGEGDLNPEVEAFNADAAGDDAPADEPAPKPTRNKK